MRYVLLVSSDENAPISPQERSRRDTAFSWLQNQMRARGTPIVGERMQPSEAAITVRCWDGGDVIITAGPTASAREQLGAVFIVDCEDLDEAIGLATTIPAAWYGTVEVWPVLAEWPRDEDRLASYNSEDVKAVG